MARLPIPDSDDGMWGDILNEFLRVSHDEGGFLKSATVGTGQIADSSVTYDKLSAALQTQIDESAVDGREVEMRAASTHIQWRYVADPTWSNLIALEELVGEAGPQGDDGLSAYQVAVQNGFIGSEAQWLDSLKGQDGADAPSGIVVVEHGTNGSTPRPTGAVLVWWIGSVAPANAQINDVWHGGL